MIEIGPLGFRISPGINIGGTAPFFIPWAEVTKARSEKGLVWIDLKRTNDSLIVFPGSDSGVIGAMDESWSRYVASHPTLDHLAAIYPDYEFEITREFPGISVSVGATRLLNLYVIQIGPLGFRVSPEINIGTAPLFIPWAEVTQVEASDILVCIGLKRTNYSLSVFPGSDSGVIGAMDESWSRYVASHPPRVSGLPVAGQEEAPPSA